MPKYVVTLEEIVTYDVTVEAANEEEARTAAEDAFVQAGDLGEFPTTVHDREVANVELLSAESAEASA